MIYREERDCTKWAKERIREIITGAQLTPGDVRMFDSVFIGSSPFRLRVLRSVTVRRLSYSPRYGIVILVVLDSSLG